MLFAYLGPDTMLPLTSAFAAVIGVVLMFGKQSWRIAWYSLAWCGRLVGLRPREASAEGRRAHPAHQKAARPSARPRRRAAENADKVEP